MKILLIHNYYQQPGGEDVVFEAEGDLLSSNGHLVEQLIFKNTQIKSRIQQLKTALFSLYNPTAYRLVEQKILSFHPDVIHVHNFWPVASPSVFYAAAKYKVPVVHSLHNFRLLCPGATLFHNGKIYEKSVNRLFPWDAIMKKVYRNSMLQTAILALMTAYHHYSGTWQNKIDRYIALTHFQKEKFENSKLAIASEKIAVKPNFTADYGRGRFFRDDFFLFVGRLTEEKGIETLLKAAQLYPFNLVILGDGPMHRTVELASYAIDNITYLGQAPRATVTRYLKKCKALIFTSVWYEGYPLTILEAFATGTPVIASRLGSMEEIVKHDYNGLHFTPGNAADLVKSIRRLLYDRQLAATLSLNARITYLRKYSPKINYKELIKIYDEVIQSHQPKLKKEAVLPVKHKTVPN